IGIIAIIPYEMATLMDQQNVGGIPIELVIMINKIVQIVFLFVLVLFGIRFQKRTSLSAPLLESLIYERKLLPYSKKWLAIGIGVTFVLTLITVLLENFVFVPVIETTESVPVWWHGLLASL